MNAAQSEAYGLRHGTKGTHSSRTMMLDELRALMSAVPGEATTEDYQRAVVEENALAKHTLATRQSSAQRLRELYGLDPKIPLFRVLRKLWALDPEGRPLLALLAAAARDPLLRASAKAVLSLPLRQELTRTGMIAGLQGEIGSRLSEATLDKVARNVGSTWTQSGHLAGRVRKVRQQVRATPACAAFAAWLGQAEGRATRALLDSPWQRMLDLTPGQAADLLLRAKQMNLIRMTMGGDILDLDLSPLDSNP